MGAIEATAAMAARSCDSRTRSGNPLPSGPGSPTLHGHAADRPPRRVFRLVDARVPFLVVCLRAKRLGRPLSPPGRDWRGTASATGPRVPLSGVERVRELRLPRHAWDLGRVLFAAVQRLRRELPFGAWLPAAGARSGLPRRDEAASSGGQVPGAVRAVEQL